MVTGLDIGSSSVKGIVLEERKDGSLSVITAFKHPSAGMRKGVLADVEDAGAALRDLVLDLQRISKKATQNVFVNFQSEYVKTRLSQGMVAVARADQEIHEDDIERVTEQARAVKLPNNYTILHNIVREYLVDEIGDIADPIGMTGNRLGVSTLVVEAFLPHLDQLVHTLERIGVQIGGVIYDPLASARASLSKKQKDLGVLLLQIGAGTTSLAVYEQGKILHTKTVPVGSGYVTNDIAIGLQTSVDTAERLKTTYGYALAKEIPQKESIKLNELDSSLQGEVKRRLLAEIIEIRLAEILDLVDNELKSLGRNVQLPGGVVLTGGGVKLPGMVELVRQEMRLPVQIGFPNISTLDATNPAHADLLDDPEFSTAVGLALWGVSEQGKKGYSPSPATTWLKKIAKTFIP